MSISSAGIGSGLPVDSIVSKLMEVEAQPITALQTDEASYNAQVTAYGSVTSALSTFQTAVQALSDASKFNALSTTVGDSSVLTASTASSAAAGNYSLEVSQLAQSQKLVTSGQTNASTAIGSGTLTFDFGTITGSATNGTYASGTTFVSNGAGTKSVTIDASDNSLTGIMNAINSAQIGVTATIINDGSGAPYRLSLTSTSTGEANSMKITVGGGDPALSALLSQDPQETQALTETSAAKNAKFTLDGVAVSKASNSVTDVIAGVTLNLKKTNVGAATTVAVAIDPTAITAAVKQFVDGYNKVQTLMTSMTAVSYDAATKKSTSGALGADSTARGIQTSLRKLLTSAVGDGSGSYSVLSDIGVTILKDGTMTTDDTKLQKAITSNYGKIAGLFAAVGTTTDSMLSYDSATTKTQAGSYAINITQLASQGTQSGAAAANLTIDSSNNSLDITLDGTHATITLDAGTYTADALAAQLQAKINGVSDFSSLSSAVTVTQNNGILSLTSNRYGSASNINITGSGASSLLGGSGATTVGVDIVGTINGVAGIATGQYLTGAKGDASEGLKIKIDGSALGSRGTVSYTQGYAYQFDQLITSQISDTGPIKTRTDGIAASLKTMDAQIAALQTRYTATEARYRAQYTALDVTMANLNATSTSLAAQLAKL